MPALTSHLCSCLESHISHKPTPPACSSITSNFLHPKLTALSALQNQLLSSTRVLQSGHCWSSMLLTQLLPFSRGLNFLSPLQLVCQQIPTFLPLTMSLRVVPESPSFLPPTQTEPLSLSSRSLLHLDPFSLFPLHLSYDPQINLSKYHFLQDMPLLRSLK